MNTIWQSCCDIQRGPLERSDKEAFYQQRGVTPRGGNAFLLPWKTVRTVSLLATSKDKLEVVNSASKPFFKANNTIDFIKSHC